MALKHKTLEELFAPIADAIRGQTGASGDVIADDFPDVLRELFARLGKDVLTLATDIAGMPYATVADLKAAVASAVAAIGPNATWAQVQYYIINNAVVDADTAQAESDEYCWWRSGVDVDPLYTEFLTQMSVYALSGSTTDINWFTLARINALIFRRNEDGAAFTAALLTQAKTRLKGVIESAVIDPHYWDGTKISLTWYQVQYALISTAGDLVDPTTVARAKDYDWAPNWAKAAYPLPEVSP